MDWSKLSENELAAFIHENFMRNQGWASDLDNLSTRQQQAQYVFAKLQQNPQSIYTLPVVDLYLATHYPGPRNKIYTQEQILNLTPDQIQAFAQVLRFNVQDSNLQTNRERILRILRFLNLIQLYQGQGVQFLEGYPILSDLELNGDIIDFPIYATKDDYQQMILLDDNYLSDWSFLNQAAIRTSGPINIKFDFQDLDDQSVIRYQQVMPTNGIVTVGDVFRAIFKNNEEVMDLYQGRDAQYEKVQVYPLKHEGGNQFSIEYVHD